jgi:chemotaxis signal transduction protein
LFSIIVDSIGDVLDLDPASWSPPPETLDATHKTFVFGICPIGSGVILGLKAENLSGDLDLDDGSVAK